MHGTSLWCHAALLHGECSGLYYELISLLHELKPRTYSRVQPRVFQDVILARASDSPRKIPPGKMPLQALQAKPAHFLTAHLKRLCIPHQAMIPQAATELLHACTGLVDLAVWIEFTNVDQQPKGQADETLVTQFFSAVESLQGLLRLSFVYDNFAKLKWDPTSPPAWCSRLKYLELVFWHSTLILPIPLLKHMTSLTHLALRPRYYQRDAFDVMWALPPRPTLKVVLIALYDVSEDLIHSVPPDIRVVYREIAGAVEEWRSSNRWKKAEEEIARRSSISR